MPNLDDLADIGNVWSMIDSSEAMLYYAEEPEDEGNVACAAWEQKFGTEDIGEEDYWCDQGRVYVCVEDYYCEEDELDDTGAVVTEGACTRPYCSASTPSLDEYGVWALTRAEGNYDEYDESEMEEREEEWFGASFEFDEALGRYCVDDYTFSESGPWADTIFDSPSGNAWIENGVACTLDEDLWRRYLNTRV